MATLKEKAKAKMDAYKKARKKKKDAKDKKAWTKMMNQTAAAEKKKRVKKRTKAFKKANPDAYMKMKAGIPGHEVDERRDKITPSVDRLGSYEKSGQRYDWDTGKWKKPAKEDKPRKKPSPTQ